MTLAVDTAPVAVGGDSMRRAMAWIALCAVTWAFLEVALGAMFHSTPPVLQIVWWRYGVHLCVVAALWGARGTRIVRTKRPIFHVGRAMLMLVMPGSFALALALGGSIEAVSAIFWTMPLLVLAFSHFIVRETPPLAVIFLSVFGAAAAAFLFGHLRGAPIAALALGLVEAGALGLYVVMTRQLREEAVETNLFYTAAPVFLILTPFMPGLFVAPDLHDAIVMSMIGVVGFVSLYALDRACDAAPAWMGVNAFFIQIAVSVMLMLGLSGVAPGLRALVAVAALLGLVAAQWVFSKRIAARRSAPLVG